VPVGRANDDRGESRANRFLSRTCSKTFARRRSEKPGHFLPENGQLFPRGGGLSTLVRSNEKRGVPPFDE
jgi:hypothetical protein